MIGPHSSYAPTDEQCMRLAPIPITEAKARLSDLEKHMEGARFELPLLYDFAKFLTGYLGDKVDPKGFVHAYEHALAILEKETAFRTQRPVPEGLIGYSHWILHEGLHAYIPSVAQAVFPENFARGVSAIFHTTKEGKHKKEPVPVQIGLFEKYPQ